MLKLIAEGDKLVKSQKLEEAIERYNTALTYTDRAPITHFKLAKLFSLKKEANKSLKHLAKAIQQGYKKFDIINHDSELSYLRNTTVFKHFVDNGYKILTNQTEVMNPLSRIEELEKFSELFEKGILTKDEFENEKKKILSMER